MPRYQSNLHNLLKLGAYFAIKGTYCYLFILYKVCSADAVYLNGTCRIYTFLLLREIYHLVCDIVCGVEMLISFFFLFNVTYYFCRMFPHR